MHCCKVSHLYQANDQCSQCFFDTNIVFIIMLQRLVAFFETVSLHPIQAVRLERCWRSLNIGPITQIVYPLVGHPAKLEADLDQVIWFVKWLDDLRIRR